MKLQGMKQIAAHVGMSDDTVLDWVRSRGFPARRIVGIYEADTDEIQAWKDRQAVISSPIGRAFDALAARVEVLEAAATKRAGRKASATNGGQ